MVHSLSRHWRALADLRLYGRVRAREVQRSTLASICLYRTEVAIASISSAVVGASASTILEIVQVEEWQGERIARIAKAMRQHECRLRACTTSAKSGEVKGKRT